MQRAAVSQEAVGGCAELPASTPGAGKARHDFMNYCFTMREALQDAKFTEKFRQHSGGAAARRQPSDECGSRAAGDEALATEAKPDEAHDRFRCPRCGVWRMMIWLCPDHVSCFDCCGAFHQEDEGATPVGATGQRALLPGLPRATDASPPSGNGG